MKIEKFEDLEIWKLSLKVVESIYKLVSKESFKRDFGIKDQLTRAAVSINSNIAEGFEKNNNNEFVRYLKISKGSTGELKSQLLVCKKINYIDETEYKNIESNIESLRNQLARFINYLEKNKKIYKLINKK